MAGKVVLAVHNDKVIYINKHVMFFSSNRKYTI